MELTRTGFNYSQLDSETGAVIQLRNAELREKEQQLSGLIQQSMQTVWEMGEKFAEIRDRLRHNKAGGFRQWLEAEGWSKTAAYRYIQVFENFNCPTVGQLEIDLNALYLLAAPSTPEEARQEAIARAQAGEHITHQVAAGITHGLLVDERPAYTTRRDGEATSSSPEPMSLGNWTAGYCPNCRHRYVLNNETIAKNLFVGCPRCNQPNRAASWAGSPAQANGKTGENGISVATAKKVIAQENVRILPEPIREIIVDTPLATQEREVKKIAGLPLELQTQVAQRIAAGQARTVKEAHRQLKDEEIARRTAQPTVDQVGECKIIIGDARRIELDRLERYGVIIVDPPWPYDNPKDHNPRLGGYTYQPLTMQEIIDLPVPALAKQDCILFLWGTWPKVPEVVQVMAAWGFAHVTGFPWVKSAEAGNMDRAYYRTGHWVAGCSEYVVIGRRGQVSPPKTDNYLGLVGPSFEHSRKPDDVHVIAEELPGPYLELFARRIRPGWTVFGNDIERIKG